jgi:CheY-like chemotaxis protein
MPLRAIIVDDNVEFLGAARGLLERQGVRVVDVASNGAEALRGVEEHNPDVVLVDVHLGDESGFEVAGRLSPPAGRRTPVVLISAYPQEDLADLIDASAAIGFVSKSSLTAAAVVELLDRGNRSDETRSG